jgi:CheY-like chemotaxis protein
VVRALQGSTAYFVRQSGSQDLWSSPSIRTRFEFMPVDDASNAVTPASPRTPAGSIGPTILLVDDEEDLRSMCRRVLELDGATVLEAPDGVIALCLVEEWRGPLDLVITDMKMPRLGGSQLAELLSVFRPDLPVLAMTGDPGMADRRLPTLLKPFSLDELTEAAQLIKTRGSPTRHWGPERRAHAKKARQLAAAMQGRNHALRTRVDLVAVALELQRITGETSARF